MNISGSSFNSFWNSYKLDDMSNLLKTSLYQLSPSAPPSKQTMKEHESGPYNPIDADVSSEVLKKVSSVQLSNYVANLRMVRPFHFAIISILKQSFLSVDFNDHSAADRGRNAEYRSFVQNSRLLRHSVGQCRSGAIEKDGRKSAAGNPVHP